mmetsp:Transcript_6134/g.13023  ORF Transcript_6134/g.13023 Transcript_6134/m.13023 type:complete len:219 (+) Transcript_6134:626-1282(+)
MAPWRSGGRRPSPPARARAGGPSPTGSPTASNSPDTPGSASSSPGGPARTSSSPPTREGSAWSSQGGRWRRPGWTPASSGGRTEPAWASGPPWRRGSAGACPCSCAASAAASWRPAGRPWPPGAPRPPGAPQASPPRGRPGSWRTSGAAGRCCGSRGAAPATCAEEERARAAPPACPWETGSTWLGRAAPRRPSRPSRGTSPAGRSPSPPAPCSPGLA